MIRNGLNTSYISQTDNWAGGLLASVSILWLIYPYYYDFFELRRRAPGATDRSGVKGSRDMRAARVWLAVIGAAGAGPGAFPGGRTALERRC